MMPEQQYTAESLPVGGVVPGRGGNMYDLCPVGGLGFLELVSNDRDR